MKKTTANTLILILIIPLLLSICSCSGRTEETSYALGVGEDIESLVCSGRDFGSCTSLTGRIRVAFVCVSDSGSEWSFTDRVTAEKSLTAALAEIERSAAQYGAEVEFDVGSYTARIETSVPAEPNYYGWMEEAMRRAGLGSIEDSLGETKEQSAADSVILLFALAREGRAYASVASDSALEYAVCYGAEEDSFESLIYSMYGAYELSCPEALSARARDVLGDSVMNGTSGADPLTAYLVGWTDEGACVREFFDGLTVTQAEIEEARAYDRFTGFASRETEQGRYVGYLVYGVADGKGRMTYPDGRVYDGEWKNGSPHGEGSMTYPDGSVITGTWVKGEIE